MNKDAYYFPHFCNARNDRKIKRIIKELGVEGYGIYFMILEVLREQTDLKYPVADIDLLADEFRTSEQKVRTVISNYDLFVVDEDQMFFSPKLFLYLEPYFNMRKQRVAAGKKSAEARKIKMLEQPLNDRSTTVEQSKVKKSKVKKSKEEDIKKENSVKEKSLDLRKEKFRSEVAQFLHQYPKEMLKEFFEYWTEPNKSRKQMRFELEKTWELGRRLSRWARNNKVDKSENSSRLSTSIKK